MGEDTYRVSCNVDLDKMSRFFDVDCEADCTTVSGWVMEQLGRIPNEGDTFTWENLDVTVTDTDYRRVLEIEVHCRPKRPRTKKKIDLHPLPVWPLGRAGGGFSAKKLGHINQPASNPVS